MKNTEIAQVFQDIADLLELKGENPFKIRAYQKVVRSIEHLPVEVEQLVAEDRLKQIPGAGEAITKKITELVTTGHLGYYESLKAEFPEGWGDSCSSLCRLFFYAVWSVDESESDEAGPV